MSIHDGKMGGGDELRRGRGGRQAPPAESFRVGAIYRSIFGRKRAAKSVLRGIFSRFPAFRLERQPENSVLPVGTRRTGVSDVIFAVFSLFVGKFSRFSDPTDISHTRNEVFGHRRCPKPTGMTSTNYFRL